MAKRIFPLTIILMEYLARASFKKRYTEVANGEISYVEGSYDDLSKYSKLLLFKGFKNKVVIPNEYHSDVKSHSIENDKYKIIFTTDTTLKRSNIKVELL